MSGDKRNLCPSKPPLPAVGTTEAKAGKPALRRGAGIALPAVLGLAMTATAADWTVTTVSSMEHLISTPATKIGIGYVTNDLPLSVDMAASIKGTVGIYGTGGAFKALHLRAGSGIGDATRIGFVGDGEGEYAQIQGQVVGKNSLGNLANSGKLAFRTRSSGADKTDNMTDRMVIDQDGLVGIGISAPQAFVHLKKDGVSGEVLRVTSNGTQNSTVRALTLENNNTPGPGNLGQAVEINFTLERASPTQQIDAARIRMGKESDFANATNSDSYLAFYTMKDGSTQERVRIKSDGSVDVAGPVKVGSITTKTWTVAPDYVFEKDYKLASLGEVDAFVQKHKHLPEVPSAKSFKEKGMDLSEMNFLLLKKVEELTLHAIRQEKQMKRQEAEMKRQASEFEEFKKKISQ